MTVRDWYAWHQDYDDPGSPLARRGADGQLRRFGNITGADIERTVGYCTQLCAPGGTVVWTRGRWGPDLVPQICDWFAGRGFEQVWVSDPATRWGVAAHRFAGTPVPLEPGARMFTFTR